MDSEVQHIAGQKRGRTSCQGFEGNGTPLEDGKADMQGRGLAATREAGDFTAGKHPLISYAWSRTQPVMQVEGASSSHYEPYFANNKVKFTRCNMLKS